MRDKVLAVIEAYAAGGTVSAALASVGIDKKPFYKLIRKDPEILALYEACNKVRAHVMLDEAYELGSDKELDPRSVRVMAEIRMKLAALQNPDRFGDRVNVQHDVKPSIISAIEAGKQRALRPPSNLADIIDTTCTEIPTACAAQAADKQSASDEIAGGQATEIDPFA